MDISRRYRRRKQNAWAKRGFFSGIVIIVLLSALVGIFWSSYFQVHAIVIEGNVDRQKTEKQLRQHFENTKKWYAPSSSIFFLDLKGAALSLRQAHIGIPVIAKQYPDAIRVTFQKYAPFFVWCGGNANCFYIAQNGLIIAESPQFSEFPLPVIAFAKPIVFSDVTLGSFLIDPRAATFLATLSTRLFEELRTSATAIELYQKNTSENTFSTAVEEAKVFMDDDWYIFVRTDSDPERIFDDLKLLLQKKELLGETISSVDLRFENKAFYKTR